MIKREKANQPIGTSCYPFIDFIFISLSLLLNFLFSKGWRIAIDHSPKALQLWVFILNASHPAKKRKGKKVVSIWLENGVIFVQEKLVADPDHC